MSRSLPESVRAEAAAWIARLHGPQRSAELEAGLHRWLAENSNNARAFERMTEAWEEATNLAAGHFPRVRARRRAVPKAWKVAAALLLAVGIAAFVTRAWWHGSSYTTDIGEQRVLRLEDGSRVSLNSRSRIVVDYQPSVRRLRLEKGEAFFEVAANQRRPFVVSAGEREVLALGTSFSVRYEQDRLAVTLVDGKVAVSPPSASNAASLAPAVTLSPGERLTLTKNESPHVDAPRVEAVTAWRRGEVMLEKTPLADAVAEMNRYDKVRLVIDDPDIDGLLVSGIYRTGDSAGFARAVEVVHGIEAIQQDDRIRLRGRQRAAR